MYQFRIEVTLPDGREATFVHNPPMVHWDRFAADNDAHLVRLFCEAREWVARPQSRPGATSSSPTPRVSAEERSDDTTDLGGSE